MRKMSERISILFLSLILLSAYSISAALPQMKASFPDVPPEWVEMMVSVSSLAVMLTVVADLWIRRLLSERASIICGLILVTFSGTVPVWCRGFGLIFASRVVLGIGLGLVNSCAITIIQDRYEGREQAYLLGVRGSMETLGGAVLTLVAGAFLKSGYSQAFWIYLTALPILILFLVFVKPGDVRSGNVGPGDVKPGDDSGDHISSGSPGELRNTEGNVCSRMYGEMKFGAGKADPDRAAAQASAPRAGEAPFLATSLLMGALFIFVNTAATLRLPDVIIDRGLGTDQTASVVLAVLQAVGVIGGIFYGRLKDWMKGYMFPVTIFLYALGDLLFAFGSGLPVIFLGAVCSGYGNGLLTTILFNRLSEKLPKEKVSAGTHLILIGCNLGATSTPLVMKLLGMISTDNRFLFIVYAVVLIILAAAEFARGAAEHAAE